MQKSRIESLDILEDSPDPLRIDFAAGRFVSEAIRGGGIRRVDKVSEGTAILRHGGHAIGIDNQRRHDNETGFSSVPFRRKKRDGFSLVLVVSALQPQTVCGSLTIK